MKTWLFDEDDIVRENIGVPRGVKYLTLMYVANRWFFQCWLDAPTDRQLDDFLLSPLQVGGQQ